eukprot:EG_transcript_10739
MPISFSGHVNILSGLPQGSEAGYLCKWRTSHGVAGQTPGCAVSDGAVAWHAAFEFSYEGSPSREWTMTFEIFEKTRFERRSRRVAVLPLALQPYAAEGGPRRLVLPCPIFRWACSLQVDIAVHLSVYPAVEACHQDTAINALSPLCDSDPPTPATPMNHCQGRVEADLAALAGEERGCRLGLATQAHAGWVAAVGGLLRAVVAQTLREEEAVHRRWLEEWQAQQAAALRHGAGWPNLSATGRGTAQTPEEAVLPVPREPVPLPHSPGPTDPCAAPASTGSCPGTPTLNSPGPLSLPLRCPSDCTTPPPRQPSLSIPNETATVPPSPATTDAGITALLCLTNISDAAVDWNGVPRRWDSRGSGPRSLPSPSHTVLSGCSRVTSVSGKSRSLRAPRVYGIGSNHNVQRTEGVPSLSALARSLQRGKAVSARVLHPAPWKVPGPAPGIRRSTGGPAPPSVPAPPLRCLPLTPPPGLAPSRRPPSRQPPKSTDGHS